MEKIWILLIAILLFGLFIFLFWRLTNAHAKKGYGGKLWKHWPTKLSYWQAAILYSAGLTAITLLLLNWGDMLNF